jgi:hypothetical protein
VPSVSRALRPTGATPRDLSGNSRWSLAAAQAALDHSGTPNLVAPRPTPFVAATLHRMFGNLTDWSDLGSAVSGLAAVVLAAAAIIGGSAGLGDWRSRQRAEGALADEQTRNIKLERRRILNGWSPHGLPVYGVTLVTDEAELAKAAQELSVVGPTEYVALRVSESAFGNANRADSLRQLISSEGYLTRPPAAGEYEALEQGIKIISSESTWPDAQAGRAADRDDESAG